MATPWSRLKVPFTYLVSFDENNLFVNNYGNFGRWWKQKSI